MCWSRAISLLAGPAEEEGGSGGLSILFSWWPFLPRTFYHGQFSTAITTNDAMDNGLLDTRIAIVFFSSVCVSFFRCFMQLLCLFPFFFTTGRKIWELGWGDLWVYCVEKGGQEGFGGDMIPFATSFSLYLTVRESRIKCRIRGEQGEIAAF